MLAMTHVIIDEQTIQKLKHIAVDRKTNVSQLLRDAVNKTYFTLPEQTKESIV